MNEIGWEELRQECRSISAKVANANGFVSVSSLLDHFSLKIEFRPLLVEAMLAQDYNDEKGFYWRVFVNSDMWPNISVDSETTQSPLPVRLRNTIAHELAHVLQFKVSASGFQYRMRRKNSVGREIKRIENETEKLSQFLLISDGAIKRFLEDPDAITIDALDRLCFQLAVSKELLVNRLNLLKGQQGSLVDILYKQRATDIAIGICQSVSGKGIQLKRSSRFFLNFSDNLYPDFMRALKAIPKSESDTLRSFDEIGLGQYESELLDQGEIVFNCSAGTDRSKGLTNMKIKMSVTRPFQIKGTCFILFQRLPD